MSKLYTTLIIDDEAPARQGLQNLLASFPKTFTILGTAKNGIEAQEKIETLQPDLIFLDVEMPGCTGFELIEKLKYLPIIIFCTAYDQYSLEAFETNSIDYLVKPVKLERIKKTINKLKSFENNISSDQILNVLKEIASKKEVKQMTTITVKKDDRLIFIKLDEVAFFEADANYTNIHTNLDTFLSTETIANLEQKLPDNFLRIHRGSIINKDFVNDIQKYFNSRFIITLKNNQKTKITSGRSYMQAIKNWMNL
ncbi:LytR/AlgR family response regulator transcription factor [Polaribacter ponticola]|uniref:LytTR family DNA-binding domain-containing protein n=1 Tax=Polaribacter ponticola TaxID=2978475 RepID=A0ABT5SB05_9FLAO|nr:LytTR family DNA-binding domain-containing protein [Polaribacter sp. MSW5]MDD7915294.1 LytTR family DNA-binding domain-containing protein [Polaribacter sp. MSW5]